MLTLLIIMTLLVGFFIGVVLTVYVAIRWQIKDEKADAMERHPAGKQMKDGDILPFNVE
jgi:Na+/H+ antiporter NhaA